MIFRRNIYSKKNAMQTNSDLSKDENVKPKLFYFINSEQYLSYYSGNRFGSKGIRTWPSKYLF